MSYAQRMNSPSNGSAQQSAKPQTTRVNAHARPASAAGTAAPAAVQKQQHAQPAQGANKPPTQQSSDDDLGAPTKKIAGYATVKAVTSGDSLVVSGNGGVEKRISLSGILAPKFGTREQPDEPFAWHSREFLRAKVLGQVVYFAINSGGKGGRDYADVSLRNPKSNDAGEDLAMFIVKNGWARVKQPKDSKLPDDNELVVLEKRAEASQAGVFQKKNPKETVRDVDYNVDSFTLYQKCKNAKIPAVVDKVIDGSTIRVELLDPAGTLKHKIVNLTLAGVACPRVPMPYSVRRVNYEKRLKENPDLKESPPKQELPMPAGAQEAASFVETRLLNQSVYVILQGCDKMNNLFGTIAFHKGNISHKLLEKGLGNLVEWSVALCSPADQKVMREMHERAKATKQGLFHSYDASAESASVDASAYAKFLKHEQEVKIVQVLSGDSFTAVDSDKVEYKFFLASVRAPRIQRGKMVDPYSFESREFFRKRLIGKKVKITFAYKRGENDSGDTRYFVDVLNNGINVAVEMLQKGMVETIRHGKDEERSKFYDSYLSAEAQAQAAGLGMHSKKPQPPPQIADLTVLPSKGGKGEEKKEDSKDSNRAKLVFNSLVGSSHPAVVEYVFSGARYKLYVPTINSYIAFAVSHIRVPAKVKDATIDEAQLFSRSKLLNYDVTIEVLSLGKGDVFTGNLFISGKVNHATTLLKNGYASIFGYSADKSPYKREMAEAEKSAKDAKLRIWVDYDEAKEAEELAKANADKETTEKTYKEVGQFLNVSITDIVTPVNFYVNVVGDKNVDLVAEKMKTFKPAPVNAAEPWKPVRNALCAGLFHEDNAWYRVRVDSIRKAADGKGVEYVVQFIDYGNQAVLAETALAPLPDDVAKIPQVAKPCTLAALKATKANSEYTEPACTFFHEMTFELPLVAKVEMADSNGLLHVTLTTKTESGETASINAEMVERGWVKINPRAPKKLVPLAEELEKFEQSARIEHRNIWQYGDISDDDRD